MREMEFTIEDTEALKPGMEVGVTEGVLPTSYYYTIEHALGMSANFKQGEQPADQHEKLPAGLADIFFNNHTHRLALIFDRGIQRTEILYRAEKQTTDDQPQEYRHPAEYGG